MASLSSANQVSVEVILKSGKGPLEECRMRRGLPCQDTRGRAGRHALHADPFENKIERKPP